MSLKHKILGGKKYTEVAADVDGNEVRVRALTDGEMAQIDEDGQSLLNDMTESLNDVSQGNVPVKYAHLIAKREQMRRWKIAATAIVDDEPWTVEDVKQLYVHIVDKIVDKAIFLTNGSPEEQKDLPSFPDQPGGGGDQTPA